MAVGLTLIIGYFPSQIIMGMGDKGFQVHLSSMSGRYEDGTVFKAIRPNEVTPEGVAGLNLRKVILKRNVALTAEQVELLKTRRRAIIRGDFISVE